MLARGYSVSAWHKHLGRSIGLLNLRDLRQHEEPGIELTLFFIVLVIAMAKESSSTAGTVPPVPILSDSHHSGISKRLAEAANAAKARVYANKTVSGVTPRKGELPVLPPGIQRQTFNTAIEELKRTLGSEHVVINDKPLDDGWYLEHP